jgi:hypothetical protein
MRMRFLGLFVLVAALFAAAPPAHADNGNSVQFFTHLRIEPGKTVENAVCFFCSIDAEGEINGNLVVFFGNARVKSAVHQNMVSFFSDVTTLPNASIDQNSVNIFSHLRVDENVHIGQNVVAIFASTDIARSATIDGNRVLFPFWLFGIPAVLLGFIIYAIVNAIRERHYRAHMANYPYPPRV